MALTHNRLAVDEQLSARCPSIDLLLGGHDHFYKKDLKKRIVKSGEASWTRPIRVRVRREVRVRVRVRVRAERGYALQLTDWRRFGTRSPDATR